MALYTLVTWACWIGAVFAWIGATRKCRVELFPLLYGLECSEINGQSGKDLYGHFGRIKIVAVIGIVLYLVAFVLLGSAAVSQPILRWLLGIEPTGGIPLREQEFVRQAQEVSLPWTSALLFITATLFWHGLHVHKGKVSDQIDASLRVNLVLWRWRNRAKNSFRWEEEYIHSHVLPEDIGKLFLPEPASPTKRILNGGNKADPNGAGITFLMEENELKLYIPAYYKIVQKTGKTPWSQDGTLGISWVKGKAGSAQNKTLIHFNDGAPLGTKVIYKRAHNIIAWEIEVCKLCDRERKK